MRFNKILTTGACLLLLWQSAWSSSVDQTKSFPSLAPMLERVMPAVVNVAVQGVISANDEDYDDNDEDASPNKRQAPPPPRQHNRPRKFESLGSGVIVDPKKGYVITNDHVIRHANSITVTLNDGRRLKAKLIGTDPDSDIAVLQIKANNLMSLAIGNSNKLKVGDFAVAIGNPFGLNSFGNSQTATFGIISALQRSDLQIEGVENFIQTDAAINPGNSGGALINTQGELIGINTAILAPYGGNVGIGFAIPINMAKDVMEQLIKYGSIHRGLMGIFVQHISPELAHAFGLPESTKGALVTQVNQESPAQRAGIRPGDIITSINNQKITEATQVKTIIGLLRVGSKVKLDILRNKNPIELFAVVSDVRKHEEKLQSNNPFLYGLAMRNFDQESPLHGYVVGIQVVAASDKSSGWRAGLRPGDVIVSADNHPVNSIKDLQKRADAADKQLLVHVLRGPGSLFLVLK